jgi:hypothetical protein
MPLVQPNFEYFSYESADGNTYNIRAGLEWGAIAAHGLAARGNGQPRFINTGSKRARKAIYKDLTTGRTRSGPIGTSAAFDALAIGTVVAFPVPDQTADVDYTLVALVPEKQAGSVIQSRVADHA